ncbi:MAG: cation:proton antiporter, partial [Rickettsia endosymbiont of Haemaphysalis japonica]
INNNMLLVHALNKSLITDLQRGIVIKKIKQILKTT